METAQQVGNKDISDHCPVILKYGLCNWGRKHFRFNNCWLEHNDFKGFISNCWREFNISGWKLHAFKEKLELLKERLKVWNKEVFGTLDLK